MEIEHKFCEICFSFIPKVVLLLRMQVLIVFRFKLHREFSNGLSYIGILADDLVLVSN